LNEAVFHSRDAGIAQLVERNLAKVEVAGSNPVSRSNTSLNFFLYSIAYKPFGSWQYLCQKISNEQK
jgi:hypothetical protein